MGLSYEERSALRAKRKERLQRIADSVKVRSVVRSKYRLDSVTGSIVTPRSASGTLHHGIRLYKVRVPGVGDRQLSEHTIRKMLTSESD